MDISKYELKPEQARRTFRPEDIGAEPRAGDSAILIDMVGQERAKKALDFVFSSPNKFHLALVADNLTAQTAKSYLEKKIEERRKKGEVFSATDFCYVHNFRDPIQPQFLVFPGGEGFAFREYIGEIRETLARETPGVIASNDFQNAKSKLAEEIGAQADDQVRKFYGKFMTKAVQEKWRECGWALTNGRDGAKLWWGPNKIKEDGQRIDEKEFNKLPPEKKEKYMQGWRNLQSEVQKLEEFYGELQREIDLELDARVNFLEDKTYKYLLNRAFRKALRRYSKHPKAKQFIKGLKDYAFDNKYLFFPLPTTKVPIITPQGPVLKEMACDNEETKKMQQLMASGENPMVPFEVNLLVDNGETDGPPIVIETSPTYSSLFGKIERTMLIGQMAMGTVVDHTMIKGGSFHRANGGFIILDLNDILYTKSFVYLGLARTLKEKELAIKDDYEELGHQQLGKMLNPEPIPLELKVIVMVKPEIYYLLWHHPPYNEFIGHFKIKAEFDSEIEYEKENLGAYFEWMDDYSKEKGFLPIETGAKAKIIEFLLRENENKNKFSWKIEALKSLIKEVQFYAVKDGAPSIQEKHILETIRENIYRSNLHEEKIRKHIEEGLRLIETSGIQTGQINGLSVSFLDNYSFGTPLRITVTTYQGSGGLISIEREAKVSDPTHSIGADTLTGFFYERYGRDKELNFEGRVRGEQIYGLNGPSASMAELLALISSISEKPIKQNIAITGTVDQMGNIGVIGGVNQKIEGFFRVCKSRGLTGNQGAIIPKTNINSLMLDEEIAEAVSGGQFHIYAIENVDQGIEILMDCPPEEIDGLINEKLAKWAKKESKNKNKKAKD